MNGLVVALFVTFAVLTAGCAPGGAGTAFEEAEDSEDAVYADSKHLWKSQIPVCWEDTTAATADGRAWVQDAVAQTWETHGPVDFIGWGACDAASNGIRIAIQDVGPHVKTLGTKLAGMKPGMVLNFTFQSWSPSCQNNREFCIRTIGVHEFGHALGFAHEQNRADTDKSWCDQEQGGDGDVAVGTWDDDSVMNYCNPQWNGDGELSQKDIAALNLLYGDEGLTGMIVNVASDKCVDVEGASYDAGTAVVSYSCHGDAHQRWQRQDAGGGNQYLYAKHSGQCLVVEGDSLADGARIVTAPCESKSSHVFRAYPYTDGSVRLVNSASGKCMDLANASSADGGGLIQWSCSGAENQRFFLK